MANGDVTYRPGPTYIFLVEAAGSDNLKDSILVRAVSMKHARVQVRDGLREDRGAELTFELKATKVGKKKAEELSEGDVRVWCEI